MDLPSNTNSLSGVKPMYKLWVVYNPKAVALGYPAKKVYYSYDRPDDPEYGKRRLLCLLNERVNFIQTALLYDTIKNTVINRFQA